MYFSYRIIEEETKRMYLKNEMRRFYPKEFKYLENFAAAMRRTKMKSGGRNSYTINLPTERLDEATSSPQQVFQKTPTVAVY